MNQKDIDAALERMAPLKRKVWPHIIKAAVVAAIVAAALAMGLPPTAGSVIRDAVTNIIGE